VRNETRVIQEHQEKMEHQDHRDQQDHQEDHPEITDNKLVYYKPQVLA
jgi:hypothetical protein